MGLKYIRNEVNFQKWKLKLKFHFPFLLKIKPLSREASPNFYCPYLKNKKLWGKQNFPAKSCFSNLKTKSIDAKPSVEKACLNYRKKYSIATISPRSFFKLRSLGSTIKFFVQMMILKENVSLLQNIPVLGQNSKRSNQLWKWNPMESYWIFVEHLQTEWRFHQNAQKLQSKVR